MEKRINIAEEAARCLLCHDAPCCKVCKQGDSARAVRAIRFGNAKLAGRWVEACSDEELEAAEQACMHICHILYFMGRSYQVYRYLFLLTNYLKM